MEEITVWERRLCYKIDLVRIFLNFYNGKEYIKHFF